MKWLIILYAVIALFIYYTPYLDISKNKVVLWYSVGNERNYIVLWSKE